MGFVQLSTRVGLAWIPEPASEPEDVLVVDVGDFFVDLRMNKADGSISWGMAGPRETLSESPLTCKWTKTIDSRGTPSGSSDIGSFEDLPNGDAIEKGSMPNPAKGGQVMEYEEFWRGVPTEGSSWPIAWILESQGEDKKTFLGRIGNYYVALNQPKEGAFGAVREDFEDGKWTTKYAVSATGLPSLKAANGSFDGEDAWKAGETITISGEQYKVLAHEKL